MNDVTLPAAPSLSEDDDDDNSSKNKNKNKNKKNKNKKNKNNNKNTETSNDDDSSSSSSEVEEMNENFTFGNDDDFTATTTTEDDDTLVSPGPFPGTKKDGITSWSYEAALKALENNDNSTDKNKEKKIEVVDSEGIVATVRGNLLRKGNNSNTNNGSDDDDSNANNDGNDNQEDDDINSDSNSEDSEDSNEDSEGDSSEDSSEEEEGVDDEKLSKAMEMDILKLRELQKKKSHSSSQKRKKRDDDDDDIKEDDDTKTNEEQDEEMDDEDDNDNCSDSDSESESETSSVNSEIISPEVLAEAKKAAAYFDDTSNNSNSNNNSTTNTQYTISSFPQLNLCRPLLRGVAAMGFVEPTMVQSRVIPVALAGRDVCASAVTGSGKTAAFLLPIAERIIQRRGFGFSSGKNKKSSSKESKMISATKGLILAPTRELAAQCVGMAVALSHYVVPALRVALIVGGSKNVAGQAAELRTRPDIIVATPGRLLDHLTNSVGVDLDDLEFLVLDEADRLLDLGFQDEVHEIIKSCPSERQTLLFSATMCTTVDELIKISLKRPVRIHVTTKTKSGINGTDNAPGELEVAERLEQEFIRVRSGNEGVNREAMLLALLTRTYTKAVIIFLDTKRQAHRMTIICGLCGMKCAELHGDLTQVERLRSLERFRNGEVDVLFATDLAARGLDVTGISAVLNFEMPSRVETYVHRIGRTARAGRGGKSCTLIGEGRRHLMKEVVKDAEEKRRRIESSGEKEAMDSSVLSSGMIRSRTIPVAVISHFSAKINSLESHVQDVLAAQIVEKMDRLAEMEASRAENQIKYAEEIGSRPKREWFADGRKKMALQEATLEKSKMLNQAADRPVVKGMHRMTRKKRRKREAMEALLEDDVDDGYDEGGGSTRSRMTEGSMKANARAFKKQMERGNKSKGEEDESNDNNKESKRGRGKDGDSTKIKKQKGKGSFESDGPGGEAIDDEGSSNTATTSKKKMLKESEKTAKSSFDFTGHDPSNGTGRRNKKKANHAFKSKSKFKRR